MDAVLRALADPSRRRILQLVRDQELPAGHIAARFALTRPAVSQHVRVLREAGLLSERREGTRRLYRARSEAIEALQEELAAFWDSRLAQLKREAEAEQEARDAAAD